MTQLGEWTSSFTKPTLDNQTWLDPPTSPSSIHHFFQFVHQNSTLPWLSWSFFSPLAHAKPSPQLPQITFSLKQTLLGPIFSLAQSSPQGMSSAQAHPFLNKTYVPWSSSQGMFVLDPHPFSLAPYFPQGIVFFLKLIISSSPFLPNHYPSLRTHLLLGPFSSQATSSF